MIPSDVDAVLPASIDRARITAHARLHASIDSPLGESHLLACGAQLLAVTRRSPFDPFQVVELKKDGVRYEEGTFSRKLTLETAAAATYVMDVSILDVEALKAFTQAIGGKVEPMTPASPLPASAPMPMPMQAREVSEDRSKARAKLLGVLKARPARRESEPFPGHERYIAPTAHLPRIPRKQVEPTKPTAEPRKKKKKKQRVEHEQHLEHASLPEPPPRDEPLFRTGHWIALLVIAPLIFLAFVMIARSMR